MEFNFKLENILGCNSQGICIIDSANLYDIKPSILITIKDIIDRIGLKASHGQNNIVTNSNKFFSSNNRLYLKYQGNILVGFIKVGLKNLFFRRDIEDYYEEHPNVLCLLDFYVYESCQRRGYGKELFDNMINFEKTYPGKLAYDYPSKALINFLSKHYKLTNKISQSNNFMIFKEFYIDNFKTFNCEKEDFDKGKYQINSNNINDSSGKMANLGRDLICNHIIIIDKINREVSKNEKSFINLNNSTIDNGKNITNQNNNSTILNTINNINDKTTSRDKNFDNKGQSKSTNFADRKNFAMFYLNDLNNSPQNKKISSFPINYSSKLVSQKEYISPHERYFYEKFSSNIKEIEMTKDRVKNLEYKVNPEKSEFYEYYKRNDYAVINEKPVRRQNLLYYLQNTDGPYNKNIDIKPMHPFS